MLLGILTATAPIGGAGCRRLSAPAETGSAAYAVAHAPLLRSDDSRGVTVDVAQAGSRVQCLLATPTQRAVISVAEAWYVVLGVPIVQRWREVARCGGGARFSDTSFVLSVDEDGREAALRRPFQTWLLVAWDSGGHGTHWSQLERYSATRVGDSLAVAFGPTPERDGERKPRGTPSTATVRVGPLWPAASTESARSLDPPS